MYINEQQKMTKSIILITILILGSIPLIGQDNRNNTDSISVDLIGTWYLIKQGTKDTLTFSSTSVSRGYGSRIEIYRNGDFVDAYGAPCGNDGQIHNDKGKWTFDTNTSVFTTTIPIDNGSTIYKVYLIESNRLILTKEK